MATSSSSSHYSHSILVMFVAILLIQTVISRSSHRNLCQSLFLNKVAGLSIHIKAMVSSKKWIKWKLLFFLNNQRDFLLDVFQQQFRDLNDWHFCYVWLLYAKILFLEFRTSCSIIERDFESPSLTKYSFWERMFQWCCKHDIAKATAFR